MVVSRFPCGGFGNLFTMAAQERTDAERPDIADPGSISGLLTHVLPCPGRRRCSNCFFKNERLEGMAKTRGIGAYPELSSFSHSWARRSENGAGLLGRV